MLALLHMSEPMTQRLATILIHFLWQGTAIALGLALITHITYVRRPAIRYCCSLIAFLLMAICPVVTNLWIPANSESLVTPTANPMDRLVLTQTDDRTKGLSGDESQRLAVKGSTTSIPDLTGAPGKLAELASGAATQNSAEAGRAAREPVTTVSASSKRPAVWRLLQPVVVALWLVGVSLLSLRLLLGWIGVTRLRQRSVSCPEMVVQRVRRLAESLRIALPLVRQSQHVVEAIAVGFLKPMVLLPVAWVTELPPDMLDAVIAHELAHIRRGDLWINLLQRVLETLLFYHPAVWWLSRRMRIERELCCDELVVAVTCNRVRYAETLEHIARLSLARTPSLLVVSIAGNRSVLLERIRHILNLQPRDRSLNVWLAGALPLAIAGMIWWSATALPAAAVNQEVLWNVDEEASRGPDMVFGYSEPSPPRNYPDMDLVEREIGVVPFQHEESVASLGWLDEGRSLLTSSRIGLRVWDVATRRIKWQMDKVGENDCLASVDRAGTRIAMVADWGEPVIVEWPSGTVLRKIPEAYISSDGGSKRVASPQAIALSPDGQKLALAYVHTGNHGYLRIYDINSGKLLVHRPGPPTPALCWTPNSQVLAAGEKRGIVVFVNLDGSLQRPGIRLTKVEQPVGLTFNRDGSRLAVLTSTGSTSVWEMATRKPVWNWEAAANLGQSDVRQSYGGLLFNRDESKLITRAFREVKVFLATNGDIVPAGPLPELGSAKPVLSPDGSLIAAGAPRDGVDLLDSSTLESTLPTAAMQVAGIKKISLSPNRQHLLAFGTRLIQVLDAQSLEVKGQVTTTSRIDDACWNPQGEFFAILRNGSKETSAAIDVVSFSPAAMQSNGQTTVIRTVPIDVPYARSLTYTTDSQLVAVAEPRHVSLWNVTEGRQVWRKEVCNQGEWLEALAVSPDGKGIAAVVHQNGTDGAVLCLDAYNGDVLGSLPTVGRPLRLLFTDARTLVTLVDYESGHFRNDRPVAIFTEWDFEKREQKLERTITSTDSSPLESVLAYDKQLNRLLLALPISSIVTADCSLRDLETHAELHHFQLPGRIVDAACLPGNRVAFVRGNGNLVVLRSPVVPNNAPEANGVAVANPPAAPADKLSQLIGQVRQQEDRVRAYSATLKMSREYAAPQKDKPQEGFSFGAFPVRSTTETDQQTVQGKRQKLVGDDTLLMTSGEKIVSNRSSVFDGNVTTTIDEGRCATIYEGLVESNRMLPPHAWGMRFLQVNFPLSTYLGGTDTIKRERKAGQFPVERGSVYEFYKVEAEVIGDEIVDERPCIKVRIKRWHYTNGDPMLQDLWLAKDRNLHVARTRSAYLQKGAEIVSGTSRVTKWQVVASGIWLPVSVEMEPLPPDANRPAFIASERLVVENALLNPTLPDGFFNPPKIPAELPKFRVSAERRLTDSPRHPKPAQAAPDTTLESILNRLAEEEKKYNDYKVVTHDRYAHLSKDLHGGGITVSEDSRDTSFVSQDRAYYIKHETSKSASGESRMSSEEQSYDGQSTRTVWKYGQPPQQQINASLKLGPDSELAVLRPHALLFRRERNLNWLAKYLKSGWSDFINKYEMTVEYVGDEQIDDLHCHKLKCVTVSNISFFLWLARDRNLIPIRREWHEPAWNSTLPTGVMYVSELREIQPGLWFPYRSTNVAFQKFARDGLVQSQIALQWRYETDVESVETGVKAKDSQVQIEVSEGTRVQVQDEQNQYLGEFKQGKSGSINIGPEALLDLRQKAQVNKEEEARRQAALAALIGKPAPELSGAMWLNSSPLSWKDLAGKVVIIDFWATWCGPCESDLHRLAELHQLYQDKGITNRVILGVHTAGTEKEKIVKAAAEKKMGYPIIIDAIAKDGKPSWGDLCEKFAVQQLPMTMVIDREGKIAAYGRLEDMLSKASQLAKP